MRIEINHEKLSDSPYCTITKSNFISNQSEEINQLKQELTNGTPTCYLVSGYRGSGKTSLLKQIEDQLSEDLVFVYSNFPKYESHEIILRKIIRALYFAVQKKAKPKSKDLVESIKRLYIRTFFNVENIGSLVHSKEKNTSLKINFDIANIILFSITILTGLNFKFNFINNLLTGFFDVIIFIISILSIVIKNVDFTALFKTNKKNEAKSIVSEMYDNEIAEYHLKTILDEAIEKKLKIIFVLDELDKIDNASDTTVLINELKPLMLSGLCNFILITGQSFFYTYRKSQLSDDNTLFSMFSKTVHTKLFNKNDFVELFKLYMKDQKKLQEKIVDKFLDSLILESNKLPRKFINLIRQYLYWENNNAFIDLIDSDLSGYETDSKILNIIDNISEDTVNTFSYSDPIKDFLLVQLHLISSKIKLIKASFTLEDVFDIENYDSKLYPTETLIELSTLTQLLLKKLCDNSLLESKEFEIDEEKVIRYNWKEEIAINEIYQNDFTETIKSKYIDSFINFEKSIRDMSIDLFGDFRYDKKSSIKKMYNVLLNNEVLTKNIFDRGEFDNIVRIRNDLVHGSNINKYDDELLKNYEILLNRFQYIAYEEYSYYVTKDYLMRKNFETRKCEKDEYFDFISESKSESQTLKIYFEVKMGRLRINSILDQINRFSDLLKYDENQLYLVIYAYEKNRKNFDNLMSKIQDVLLQSDILERVFIFYTSEYRSDFSSGRIQVYLDKVLKRIDDDSERNQT